MTTTISLRDLSRGTKAFENYDFVRIKDKKTNKNKGLIISSKYADAVEEMIEEFINKQKQRELDDIMQFVGGLEIKKEFKNMNIQQIKAAKYKKYE
jgi:predicted house-cleaning noncanonical NTP pyrophosphatase (MazG superfamily)